MQSAGVNKENTEPSTSNKGIAIGAPGIATRSKDATMGSWPYY